MTERKTTWTESGKVGVPDRYDARGVTVQSGSTGVTGQLRILAVVSPRSSDEPHQVAD